MNIETFLSAVGGALLLHFFPDKVAWVADWVFQGHIEVFSDYVQSTTMFLTAFMAAYFVVFWASRLALHSPPSRRRSNKSMRAHRDVAKINIFATRVTL